MSDPNIKEEYSQLKDVLQSPIATLQLNDHTSTLIETKGVLIKSKQCCIVVATSRSTNKLINMITLYQSLVILKKLKQQLSKDYIFSDTSLIGIYPSLKYPACVYQLQTGADRYVSANVLPGGDSAIAGLIKYIISRILGTNPAIGGLGLILYRI